MHILRAKMSQALEKDDKVPQFESPMLKKKKKILSVRIFLFCHKSPPSKAEHTILIID